MGYGVNISLNTYAAIHGKKECKLYIYVAIREDAHVLYGFADKQERELFLLLISVSGIGGNTARMILHEFGHFAVAKLCGIQVNEFSIGMGPALWKKIYKGTQYSPVSYTHLKCSHIVLICSCPASVYIS